MIKGDSGNDFVFGEGGQNAFLYNTRGFNTDIIFDFNAAGDTFIFSTDVFANFAAVQAAAESIWRPHRDQRRRR